MSGRPTAPFDAALVTHAVNFHGHCLLKQLVSENEAQIHTIKLQDIDYKVYENRALDLRAMPNGISQARDIIDFIASKSDTLLTTGSQEKWTPAADQEDIYQDRYKHQLPLEYFINVPKVKRIDELFKRIEVGDYLFTEVYNYLESGSSSAVLKPLAFDCGKHRFFGSLGRLIDMKLIMKLEDTEVSKADEDRFSRWMIGTRLRVEVLSICGVYNKYILVGTKGVTEKNKNKDKKLGKVLLSDLPPILSVTPDPDLKYLSQCIEKMSNFKNPKSVKLMASKLNLDLCSYSSLMPSLRKQFPEAEQSKARRIAQQCKWAHKSVADGVTFFKNGQHEEAFQCLNKALQIDPENVEASVAKGALLANLGKYEKAIEDFEKSLSFNPGHANAKKYMCETLVELGKQLELKDKLREAEKNYARCLELNKDHAVAQEAVKSIKRKLGEDTQDTKQESFKSDELLLKDLLELENELSQEKTKEEEKFIIVLDEEEKLGSNPVERRSPIPVVTEQVPREPSLKRQDSLSPLSQKLAMQQNLWAPPSSSNTNLSYVPVMPSDEKDPTPPAQAIPSMSVFSNPPANWPIPVVTRPPPSVSCSLSLLEDERKYHGGSQLGHCHPEDDSYRKKVENFLRELQNRSLPAVKRRSTSRERSHSRKKTKHRGSRKRRKHRHSSSSSSRSYSSSSSESSRDSKSELTDSSSSSDDRRSSKKSKRSKKKHKKNKKASKKHKDKKKDKASVEKKPEEKPTLKAEMPMPDFEDLENKLLAYYKKMEEMNTSQPEIDSPEQKPEKVKKTKTGKSEGKKRASKCSGQTLPSKLHVLHPAFQEKDSGDSDSTESEPQKKSDSKGKANIKELSSPSSITSTSSRSSRSRSTSEENRSKLKAGRSREKQTRSRVRRSRSRGGRSRSRERRSRSRGGRSRSRERRSRSRGRRSSSRGRRSRSRGRRSRSRGRRSRSYGRRPLSRVPANNYFKNIRIPSRSRSKERFNRQKSRHSRSRSREKRYQGPKHPSVSPPFGYYKNKPFYSSKTTGEKMAATSIRNGSQTAKSPAKASGSSAVTSSLSLPPLPDSAPQPPLPPPIKFEIRKKRDLYAAVAVQDAKMRIQKHILSNLPKECRPTKVDVPDNARFGKWAKDSTENGSGNGSQKAPKPSESLVMFENFLNQAKQKKMELMKERNKEFLKPRLD